MTGWLPRPILTPVLMVIWLLLNNSVSPGQILIGLVVGWAIPLFTVNYWPEKVRLYRPAVLMRLLGVFLYDVVVANVAVARLILRGPKHLRPAFVPVKLDVTHPLAISLLANIISLTPGTVSAELSPDHRVLVVHALDTEDPVALAAAIKQRYEAPLKEVFQC